MKKYLGIILALALLITWVTPAYAAEAATATMMRLEKTEGTVTVVNQKGVSLPVRDNSKLYSGYSLTTKLASYAYIGLDDKKAVKLDESSTVSIKKSGKKLELLVSKGQLFFNVKELLKPDETMEIRTSNMVTGIRGTAGVINSMSASRTNFYLLDGSVEITYVDTSTGNTTKKSVKGGEVADLTRSVASDGTSTAKVQTRNLKESDISGFAAVEIAKDEDLQKKIEQETNLNVKQIVDTANEKLKKDQASNKKAQSTAKKETASQNKTKDDSRDTKPDNQPSKVEPPFTPPSIPSVDPKPEINTYTVKFDVDEGTAIKSQKVKEGNKAERPEDPTKEGYYFDDWYTSEHFETRFDFDTQITRETTVYAKWFLEDITLSEEDLTLEKLVQALTENINITLDIGDGDIFNVVGFSSGNIEIPESKKLIIDSGTFSIEDNGQLVNNGTIVIGGKFLNDGIVENSGAIEKADGRNAANPLIKNTGEFAMQDGTIDGGDCTAIENGGTMYISGGSITSSADHSVINNVDVRMSGGEILNTKETGTSIINNRIGSTLFISGGTVSGAGGGVEIASGNCIISDGAIIECFGTSGLAMRGGFTYIGGLIRGKQSDTVCDNLPSGYKVSATADEEGWYILC